MFNTVLFIIINIQKRLRSLEKEWTGGKTVIVMYTCKDGKIKKKKKRNEHFLKGRVKFKMFMRQG